MVYCCCVPGCRGNYPNTPKVQLFSFPKEQELKNRWIRAICRKNFIPTKYSKVCEQHFSKGSIRTFAEAYDEKTGKHISVPLKRPQLDINAVPSVLPNCPSYLSVGCPSNRESPDERRIRIENEFLRKSITESITTKEEYDSKKHFSSISGLSSHISALNVPEGWTVIVQSDKIMFLFIETISVPIIKSSLTIDENLQVRAFIESTCLHKMGKFSFPQIVKDVNILSDILNTLACKVNSNCTEHLSDIVESIVKSLKNLMLKLDDEQQLVIQFLIEQVDSVLCNKFHMRYPPEKLIFYSILNSISPHAYKFLKNSGYIIIPHPRTLQKICASLSTSPQLEQIDQKFLMHITNKIKYLQPEDKTVILMMDEIHIKPYLNYKGGNILGMAVNCENAATSAHVFMIHSLLSPFKEVIHIVPVRNINAENLKDIVKKILVGLHNVGFKVICVVSDNNSLNRKAMSLFLSPPKLSIVYPHPCDSKSPLFYAFDSVHILKCIRNNWINQKNVNQCFYYPSFEDFSKFPLEANFSTLKKLHEYESNTLIKFSYGLTLKSLNPTNLEKQNVKLVLKVFNEFVVQGLMELGAKHNLINYKSTADFIMLILKWWKIVNVKTPHKGQRLRDCFQEPITQSSEDEKVSYLNNFLSWLDAWKYKEYSTGCLTKETHLAITHTTYALLQMSDYCINELNFTYFLPGKIQTDCLEERFGKYRSLAGSQYLVSITQIYESEAKLRMQNFLPLTLNSSTYGTLQIQNTQIENHSLEIEENFDYSQFDLTISEEDFDLVEPLLPVLTYLSGYCARSAISKLNCNACSQMLVLDKTLSFNSDYVLIQNLDRGGLLCPSTDVVTAVVYNYVVIQKLISINNESLFLKQNNQRGIVIAISEEIINNHEFFLNSVNCSNGHLANYILKYILKPATNALLNNYCTLKNDRPKPTCKTKQRKLETVKCLPTNALLNNTENVKPVNKKRKM